MLYKREGVVVSGNENILCTYLKTTPPPFILYFSALASNTKPTGQHWHKFSLFLPQLYHSNRQVVDVQNSLYYYYLNYNVLRRRGEMTEEVLSLFLI